MLELAMAKPCESEYLDLVIQAIQVCAEYRPKFGHHGRAGLTWEEFRAVYGSDAFCSWFGLDHPLMYAAHRAAGGMTSLYRQIGIGCQRLFSRIVRDALDVSRDPDVYRDYIRGSRGEFTIAKDGTVSVTQPGNPPQTTQIGNIQLVNFINPAGLQSVGENLYLETTSSGAPQPNTPGTNGLGVLNQMYVETSNVNVAEELVNMIQAQRAYELNSKAITVSDQMLQRLTQM
jgi:hypothetical protein